jgi:hypothetical protein
VSGPEVFRSGTPSSPSPFFVDLNLPPHPILHYTDFSTSISHRPVPLDACPGDIEIYERVVTPYNADAYEMLLEQYELTNQYPLLVQNLRQGFPIGDMPILTQSVIVNNHPSVAENLDWSSCLYLYRVGCPPNVWPLYAV